MNTNRTVVTLLTVIVVLLALNLVVTSSPAGQAEGVLQRCCFPYDGHCEMFEMDDCIALQGSPGGVGSNCDFECGPGACCVLDDCDVVVDEEDCVAMGGIYQGWEPGVDCADVLCGNGPFGACCRANATCLTQSESGCNAIQGVWRGEASICGDFNQDGADDTCESIPVTCRSDSNEDGIVDIIDFLTLLQDWGPCE